MRIMIAVALFASSATASAHQPSDCREAMERYSTAHTDASLATSRYARCLRATDASDDCASEFRRVRQAQDELEQAVADLNSYCRAD